jgi:VWFA-related protein
VTTPLNQIVTGMEKENFRVYEDKVEQNVDYFASFDAPLSIGLVFDASGSMGAKLNKARQAAAQFFKTANPEDEFLLVQFNERPELVVPFTRNTEDIQSRLTFTQAKGRTALLDAIYMGLSNLKKGRNPRKALLVLSDGGDNSSRYTETEVRNVLREADAQVYAMGIFEPAGSRGRTAEELSGPGLLSELAEMTGGRHFPVENLNDLPDIAAKIGMELRHQYVIGYMSKNLARDGKYRKVQVKLNQPRGMPPLRAYHRLGYYAPTQ